MKNSSQPPCLGHHHLLPPSWPSLLLFFPFTVYFQHIHQNDSDKTCQLVSLLCSEPSSNFHLTELEPNKVSRWPSRRSLCCPYLSELLVLSFTQPLWPPGSSSCKPSLFLRVFALSLLFPARLLPQMSA